MRESDTWARIGYDHAANLYSCLRSGRWQLDNYTAVLECWPPVDAHPEAVTLRRSRALQSDRGGRRTSSDRVSGRAVRVTSRREQSTWSDCPRPDISRHAWRCNVRPEPPHAWCRHLDFGYPSGNPVAHGDLVVDKCASGPPGPSFARRYSSPIRDQPVACSPPPQSSGQHSGRA
jgi:hypothetical protein